MTEVRRGDVDDDDDDDDDEGEDEDEEGEDEDDDDEEEDEDKLDDDRIGGANHFGNSSSMSWRCS